MVAGTIDLIVDYEFCCRLVPDSFSPCRPAIWWISLAQPSKGSDKVTVITETQTLITEDLPFCDLVMKGGVASGVAYPTAIAELSCHYRFQSIGGTSVGAIAAAITAAAEYQRRQTDSLAGFALLKDLPTELGRPVESGGSKLLSLFQPQPALRRLYSVLLAGLNRETTPSRIVHILIGFMKAYWQATLLTAGIIGLVAWGLTRYYGRSVGYVYIDDWLYGFLLAVLFFALIAPWPIGIWFYRDVTRRLVEKGLGLCTGLTTDKRNEALTPWLHGHIQRAAGRRITDPPLTFEDLWHAEGSDGSEPRSIDLQVFSTNLSHGRPYIFPLADNEELYFTKADMENYLPNDIVEYLTEHSPSKQKTNDEKEYLRLPPSKHFPVLLAARLSMSFPFLFTPIPFYCCVSPTAVSGDKAFLKCWFSDGGISSNFPIHLFDGLLPRWPTFGLTLEPKLDGQDDISIAKNYSDGYEEYSNYLPDKVEREKDAGTLGWFISAIVGAMQNWNDISLTRMPGVRDRVAKIRLSDTEGGLNLNMNKDEITAVADRGKSAILQLASKFNRPQNGSAITGWDEHRFVRLHVLLNMLAARSPGVISAVSLNGQGNPYATNFMTLLTSIQTNMQGPYPPGYPHQMTKQNCIDLDNFVSELVRLAQKIQPLNTSIPFTSIPIPELRVRPPL